MSRDALVREVLRLPWHEVLPASPTPTKVVVAEPRAEPVGVVVPLRGRWWGMTIVRCDRGVAEAIAAHRGKGRYDELDRALRWLGLELAKAVRRTVDITAEIGDPILLAGTEAMWSPKNGRLHADAAFSLAGGTLSIAAFERLRSDRRTVVVEPASIADAPALPVRTTLARGRTSGTA